MPPELPVSQINLGRAHRNGQPCPMRGIKMKQDKYLADAQQTPVSLGVPQTHPEPVPNPAAGGKRDDSPAGPAAGPAGSGQGGSASGRQGSVPPEGQALSGTGAGRASGRGGSPEAGERASGDAGAAPPTPAKGGMGHQAAPPSPPVHYGPWDGWMAALCLVWGYLFLRLVRIFDLGVGVFLFALCFGGLALGYRILSGGAVPRRSWLWLGLMLASALPFAVFSNGGALPFFQLLFVMLTAVYWVASLFETRLEGVLGDFLATDLWNHFAILPFDNFFLGFGAVWNSLKGKKEKGRPGLLPAVAAVLLALPVLSYAAVQLSAADGTFARLVERITAGFQWSLEGVLLRCILAVPVGCWFFGLFFGAAQRRGGSRLTAEAAEKRSSARKICPPSAPAAVLILFALLYLVFFAAQVSSLLGALAGAGPEGGSYAQYARSGFFELCRVAVINLLLLGGTRIFTRRPQKKLPGLLRFLDLFLCAETLLLIATAMSKMLLYIQAYGLTLLRLYTSWFMALLFVGFVILILSDLKPICVARWAAGAFCAMFLGLCWCNPGGIIARHNVNRYLAGLDEALDPLALEAVAVAAAPVARELYDSGDPQVRQQAERILALAWMESTPDGEFWYQDAFWLSGSWQKLRARELASVENSLLTTVDEGGRAVRRWR